MTDYPDSDYEDTPEALNEERITNLMRELAEMSVATIISLRPSPLMSAKAGEDQTVSAA